MKPHLKRFEATILQDKSPSDPAQIPASASLTLYRSGATVKSAITLPGNDTITTVLVFDAGELSPGASLLVDGVTTTLTVFQVAPGGGSVDVKNTGVAGVPLLVGNRLTPTGSQPDFYADGLAQQVAGSSIATDPTTGRAGAYLRQRSGDLTAARAGLGTRIYPDFLGSFVPTLTNWVHASQFASIQAAIDALPPEGGTVFIPSGTHVLQAGIVINKLNVSLIGEGPATVLTPVQANQFHLITVNVAHCRISEMTLDGAAQTQDLSSSGKACLNLNGLGVSGFLVLSCLIKNVICRNAPRAGLLLRDTISSAFIHCDFSDNRGEGVHIENVVKGPTTLHFWDCTFSRNGARGLFCGQCVALSLVGCVSAMNSLDGLSGTGALSGSSVEIQRGNGVTIESCQFDPPGATVSNLCYISDNLGPVAVLCSTFNGGHSGGTGTGPDAKMGIGSTVGQPVPATLLLGCGWSDFAPSTSPPGAVASIVGQDAVSLSHAISSQDRQVYLGDPKSIDVRGATATRFYSSLSTLPSPAIVDPGTLCIVLVQAGVVWMHYSDGNSWHPLTTY